MPAVLVSRPWRRFLRFSVRGLIVLVLVIGVGLGWVVRSASIQRNAVAAITKAGGSVNYDWGRQNGIYISGRPWAPQWLVDLIGVDYFGNVTGVWLVNSSTVTEAVIAHVGRFSRLEVLHLSRSTVSDGGLAHLKGLIKLSIVSLDRTGISDSGLVHIKRMTSLSHLGLSSTQVSDAGLVHLKGLTNLKSLWIDDTKVSDAGLAHLNGLANLSELLVGDDHVTDVGLKDLQKALPKLRINPPLFLFQPAWNRPCRIARHPATVDPSPQPSP